MTMNVDAETRMTVKCWTKPQTQQTVRQLRAAGYPVTKTSSGYELLDRHNRTIFRAMIGTRGYLVTHHPDLFTYPEIAIGA